MEPRQEDQARLEGGPVSGGEVSEGRDAFAFDEAPLRDWLALHVEGFSGPLSVERFAGGQSNPTCPPSAPMAQI